MLLDYESITQYFTSHLLDLEKFIWLVRLLLIQSQSQDQLCFAIKMLSAAKVLAIRTAIPTALPLTANSLNSFTIGIKPLLFILLSAN